MGLKVWLPLISDIHNQGTWNPPTQSCGNFSFTGTGKIGATAAQGYLGWHLSEDFLDNTWSIATWCKPISLGQYNNIIFCKNISDSTDCQIYFSIVSNTTLNVGVNGPSSSLSYSYNFTLSQWYHVAATYDGKQVTLYLNGNEVNHTTVTTTKPTGRLNMQINGRSTNTAGTGTTGGATIQYNDFRIYDHALSAAEVREISQGLVLHYKLDSIDIKTGTNLVTSITKGGQTTLLTDGRIGVETSGINADTYFTINLSESIVAGTSYFLSCDASGISAGQYWGFPLGQQNNGTLPFKIYNGHNEYAFTANDTLPNGNAMNWGTNRLFMDDLSRSDWANKAQFYNFQLVKIGTGTELIVKDSSGYNHNGTINSSPIISSETMRYGSSIMFDGVDDCIKIPFNDIIKDKNYTVSVWTYKTSIGTKNYQTILGGPSGFELEARSSSSTSPLYRIHNWGGGTTVYEFNKWNLFTFVHTDSNSKLYVNSELKITGTSANIPTGNYYIGAWNSVTGQNYEGLMSDFRIYCTALDADAIRQLYEVGAKVDNKQSLHAFELVENNSKIQITKQGQIKCNELEEDEKTKFYKIDQIIETNEIIET